jgi:chromatin remodeling complex protein RSC6
MPSPLKKESKKKESKKKDSIKEEKEDDETFESTFIELKEAMGVHNEQMKVLKSMMEKLNKIHKKEIKIAGKKKKKEKDPNAPKFGIAAPSEVPKEVAEFLDLDPKKKLARTEITKKLYGYIDKNNLKDEDKKSLIHPDKKLKKLFKMDNNEELTIQSFAKFLSRCYPKKKGKKESKSESDSSSEDEKSSSDED